MNYRDLAIDALSKMTGYDPYLPSNSQAVQLAYAEALEAAGLSHKDDVLEGVRVMYRDHGDPGWRATPKALVEAARQCRKERLERMEQRMDRTAIGGPEKVTFAEFRKRHPDVKFPKLGKELPDA